MNKAYTDKNFAFGTLLQNVDAQGCRYVDLDAKRFKTPPRSGGEMQRRATSPRTFFRDVFVR